LLAAVGPLADQNLYRFSSKERDPNSGQYYYGYRFYDSNLQRWINRDPIGELGSHDLFTFAGNGPIGRIDADGYTWTVSGPKNVSYPTIKCKKGKPAPSVPNERVSDVAMLSPNGINGYFCVQKCNRAHEQCHADDALRQNPKICEGIRDGSVVINDDQNGEYLASEQKCHLAEVDCLKKCASTCPGSGPVLAAQKDNNDFLEKYKYQ
jgi:RHS repeat-associated protein